MSKFKVGQIIRWNKSPWNYMYQSYPKGLKAVVTNTPSIYGEDRIDIEWLDRLKSLEYQPTGGWPESAFIPQTPDDPYAESDF